LQLHTTESLLNVLPSSARAACQEQRLTEQLFSLDGH